MTELYGDCSINIHSLSRFYIIHEKLQTIFHPMYAYPHSSGEFIQVAYSGTNINIVLKIYPLTYELFVSHETKLDHKIFNSDISLLSFIRRIYE